MRLSRKGRKKAPFYHIIVADARSPRDGKFIEKLGTYNPMTKPATIEIDRNAAYDWLVKGAQPTDTVKAILRFKGVYYKKHLMRGVKKGAMSVEQADTLWQAWIDEKENKIESRRVVTISEKEAFRKLVSGEAKAKVVMADEATKEAAHAFKADDNVSKPVVEEVLETETEVEKTTEPIVSDVVEEVVEVAEVPSVEETPLVEDVVEPVSGDVEIVVDNSDAEETISEAISEKAAETSESEVPTEE